MPNCLTDTFFNPDLQWQRLNTHQYSENDNVQTTSKMDNLHLADFVELQLKSTNDFDAAYDIVMNAGWGDYMLKFVAIQPGDWPCQFYCRQIIYHCLKKFISFTPVCSSQSRTFSTWSFHIFISIHYWFWQGGKLGSKIDLSAPYPVCHSNCHWSSAHLLIWAMTS